MFLETIGPGRIGANLARRVTRDRQERVVFDPSTDSAVTSLAAEGTAGVALLTELPGKLTTPRAVRLMVPACEAIDSVIELTGTLDAGDRVIDGGNSYYRDDIRHATMLAGHGIRLLNGGTSSRVWDTSRGDNPTIGADADADALAQVEQVCASAAACVQAGNRTRGGERTRGFEGDVASSEQGSMRCGPSGAGHFVTLVHNGIEYGMMAAPAEELNILHRASLGVSTQARQRHPDRHQNRCRLDRLTARLHVELR